MNHVGQLSLKFDVLQSLNLVKTSRDNTSQNKRWTFLSDPDPTELQEECKTHRGPGLAVPVFVAEVPQVDGQLTQLVVPQVTVSQQDAEQGEGQGALTPEALLQHRDVSALNRSTRPHTALWKKYLPSYRFLVFLLFVILFLNPEGECPSISS